ncbi:MAG: type IX secretion system membrane protein PorP/SprF [Bacteroidota bacterium]
MLSEKISLQPQVLFYRQGKFSQLNGGANVQLHSLENNFKNFRFSAGVFYRNKDAVIARIGAGIGNLDAGFAYDFNTSDLKRASNGRGAYEVALSYIITKVKPLKKNPPCPVY